MALIMDNNNTKTSHQIAQDVMNLFQIVDAEKDLNAVFDELEVTAAPKRKVPPPVPPKRTHSSADCVKVSFLFFFVIIGIRYCNSILNSFH